MYPSTLRYTMVQYESCAVAIHPLSKRGLVSLCFVRNQSILSVPEIPLAITDSLILFEVLVSLFRTIQTISMIICHCSFFVRYR